ncbi:hypothetical protein AZI86_11270 [Bdellovibrio bacteriovorus]|uniref:Lipid/polyisoprenoid-binding YceI-like domain-containing protein n=1 Tax=Bdellovibrio bacteriovorus TaxID=959 RepID=A0A150WLW0_BDEBC|nr:hypothetical protein [Bdellovibrio bacteriovorus]KYG64777.1 hypothetical protein AZI86_11270 [Bdellovibrio bacteriovorus]
MARLKLISVIAVLFASHISLAQEVAFKYKLNLLFGMTSSCTYEGQKEISQVRFNIDKSDLNSKKDFVEAEIRLSACIITGDMIKERYSVPVPRFLFTDGAAPMQGVFNIAHPKFSKVSVDEVRRGTFQVRFIEKNGQAWKQIDPIELTLNSKASHPEKLRFYVTSKKKWIEASLRLIEGR